MRQKHDGTWTKDESVKFIHYHDQDLSKMIGAVTFAYIDTGTHIEAAFAVCSRNDQFCRKTGRDLAESRLEDPAAHEFRCYLPRAEDGGVDYAQVPTFLSTCTGYWRPVVAAMTLYHTKARQFKRAMEGVIEGLTDFLVLDNVKA